MTKISNLAQCTCCGAEMIERTNDNKLECLNCGEPFVWPVERTKVMMIEKKSYDIIDEILHDEMHNRYK